MSAAGRGKDRKKHDSYFTPAELAEVLVGLLDLQPEDLIWEPACGEGAFVRALANAQSTLRDWDDARKSRRLMAFDIVDRYEAINALNLRPCPGFKKRDFLEVDSSEGWSPDVIAGNPPYKLAEQFVRKSLRCVRSGGTVAFLLRLSFLESAKRIGLWSSFPPVHVYVLAERPSFTADGRTDSAAYAWFVWRRGYTGPTSLSVISWRSK